MQAILSNASFPHYGQISVPLPIPDEQYDRIIRMLQALEMGDALKRDCQVDVAPEEYPILQRLEMTEVNLDELDYLIKRLDSFIEDEIIKFQAMAEKLDLSDIKDFINLTFCCQKATVISDFSDLEEVGKWHFLTLNPGCDAETLEHVNGERVAIGLIRHREGTVTPYGVVYDNGMQMLHLYQGGAFPDYDYNSAVLGVKMTSRHEPEREEAYFQLPMPARRVERFLQRAGLIPDDSCLEDAYDILPSAVTDAIRMEEESLESLNEMAEAISRLDRRELPKLAAAVLLARAEGAGQIKALAENLADFDFVPDVKTPEEYGRYMIRESGRFEYDGELHEFYNYQKYGEQRIRREEGSFNAYGYICYRGTAGLQEILSMDKPRQPGFQMRGME